MSKSKATNEKGTDLGPQFRAQAHVQLDALIDARSGAMADSLNGSAKSASGALQWRLVARKDGDIDVHFSGKCTAPWNGAPMKARIEDDQLELL